MQTIINKTIPETLVTNCGYSSMKLAGGPELTSGVKKPVITLLPGTSAELPKGYTQISDLILFSIFSK